MGIRVEEGAIEAIAGSPDRFALQIHGADDVPAALAALRLVRTELVGLSGRGRRTEGETGRDGAAAAHADVSPAVATPGGPLLLVQRLDADAADLAQIPTLIAERLADCGVTEATVAVPELGGRLDALEATPGCVVLRLFPAPDGAATAIPTDWLDVAVEWMVGDLDDDESVTARVLSVEQAVAARDVADVLHDCGIARAWCDLVNGDPADKVRTASITFGRLPHLALAAGGPTADGPGLLARFELLRDVARELAADIAYACLDIEPTFEGLGLGLPVDGWRARGGASPNRVAATVVDEVVPDAYPWQVLGPRHTERLLASGEEIPPWEALSEGRVEVALGDPQEWLPRSNARDDAQDDAIAWLVPLLVDDDELDALIATRPVRPNPARPAVSASPFTPPPPPEPEGMPDLDGITLRATPTPRRSARLTPLELAAWFAHEAHSDSPESVSPVLASFVRFWSAGLDNATLQRLKDIAGRLVGTAGDPAAEQARRWAAVDWLVHEQAASWLRAAGLAEAAERLSSIGLLTDDAEVARAVDVLSAAITVAGRRIDVTSSIVGDAGDDDEGRAWEAWEAANEPSGWVAASEAATQGTPPEVVYAADLRVIETSRDSKARDELEATRTTVGNTAWAAAVHALADVAWERAWEAADHLTRDRCGLTIRIEMGRIAKAAQRRGTDEFPEAALEVAEQAAREALVRAALRGGGPDRDGEHPWDAARNAARGSPGGGAWSVVIDGSRTAVGESAWEEAMAEARDVIDDLLADAPDIIARTVAAAVAREAASAAARGIAYRAAVVARAHGADDLGADQAARESLAATTSQLTDSAFHLLDRMIKG